MRCGLSAIIPVAHEKNGASTGLKCDLAEQAQSTSFQTFTMDISVLYLPFLGSIISQVSSTECRALAASLNLYGLTTCIHDVSNDFCTPCQCPLKYGPHMTTYWHTQKLLMK